MAYNRREFVASLSIPFFATLSYGSTAFSEDAATEILKYGVNHLEAEAGRNNLERLSSSERSRIGQAAARNARYFAGDYTADSRYQSGYQNYARGGNYPTPAAYQQHYRRQWSVVERSEYRHSLVCVCCYVILHELVRETRLIEWFREEMAPNYQFPWHYDVALPNSNGYSTLTIDSYSRLRQLYRNGDLSDNFYGWAYTERSEYVVIGLDGRRLNGGPSSAYQDWTPKWLPA